MVILVSTAYIISLACIYLQLSERARKDATELVTQEIVDVVRDIYLRTDAAFLREINPYEKVLEMGDDITNEALEEILEATARNEDKEVSVIGNDGTIVSSSSKSVCGENVLGNDSESFSAASGILNRILADMESYHEKEGEKITCYFADSIDPHTSLDGERTLRYYGKTWTGHQGIVLYGVSDGLYDRELYSQCAFVASNRHVGREGYILIINEKYLTIAGGPEQFTHDRFGEAFPAPDLISEADNSTESETVTFQYQTENTDLSVYYSNGQTKLFDIPYFYAISKTGNNYILALYPRTEATRSMFVTLFYTLFMEILVFALLLVLILFLEKRIVIRDIHRLNDTLTSITQGNLDAKADVRSTYEFETLSDDINSTVDRLKGYIAEAAARIDADLTIARMIQTSALPGIFPPFPEHKEFELYATMNSAREVGGDFYDYFLLNENTLGFLIADVSGKSIPGAMFMMSSKSVLKDLAESGLPAAQVFTEANKKLCEGNDAYMFLTAWMGFLDLKSGEIRVANAGHNPPVLIRNGKAEYITLDPDLALASLDTMVYSEQKVSLQKGDVLFLYTDGVTEAMNSGDELYGEERLQKLLSFGASLPSPVDDKGIPGAVCAAVSADISAFVKGAEQSDDITMLCIRYLGQS